MTLWRSLAVITGAVLVANAASAQERTVKGTVIDSATKQGMPGAVVGVKGTSLTAVTESDGSFTLASAPGGEQVLLVQAPGYASREVTLPAGNDSARVVLSPESMGEEIVVSGRASEIKRKNVPVSIARVKGEDLREVSADTVDQALQGKVAGANIQRNDGAPGGGVQVRLRGISSINGQAEPLFVLDGMLVSNVAIPSGISAVTKSNAGSNPSLNQDSVVNRIADFQPEDIESIEVLKGAAAAAIYGSKASNGVIIINTRKGQPGPPRIDFTQRFGASFLSKELGARTFTNVDDAVAAFGEVARTYFKPGVTYNHDKDLAGRHDLATESILSISGGAENGLTYFLSGMVKSDPGIIDNTGYQKQSVRLNLGKDLTDIWHVNVNSYLIHSNASRGISNNDNTNSSFYIVLPFIPNFYDLRRRPDGTYPVNPFASNNNNPLQTAALMTNDEGVWRFLTSLDSILNLLSTSTQRLNLLFNGGLDRFQQENNLLFPPSLYWQAPEQTQNLPGTSLFGTTSNLNYNLGVNLVHNWFPAAGDFSAISSAGFQYESRDLNTVRVIGRDLVAGQNSLGAATQISVGQLAEAVHDRGGYIQEDLLLLDRKLLLTAALRGDSSSANGHPNAVYLYPKAGASYRFVAPAPNIDDLKLRIAYGETGNQPLYGQRFIGLSVAQNVNGNPAIGVTGVAGDPDIRPERAREIEAGTDLLLLGGRAIVEINLYQRTITGLLLQRAIAPSTGFTTQFFNGGVLRNRGIELSVEGTPVQYGNLFWQTQVGFAKNVSKITSLPVPAYNYLDFGTVYGVHRIEQGQSATQIVGNDGLKPDGTCCLIHKLGDSEPDFTMHFANRVAWGGFMLFFLVDWQSGSSVVNITRNLYDSGQNAVDQVPAGYNRLAQNIFTARPYVESATFVKLREVSLSYELPPSALYGIGNVAKRVRFKVSGRNLLTFTPYSGMDPEVSNFGNDPIDRNIDLAPFPPSRSVWTSVEVGFY